MTNSTRLHCNNCKYFKTVSSPNEQMSWVNFLCTHAQAHKKDYSNPNIEDKTEDYTRHYNAEGLCAFHSERGKSSFSTEQKDNIIFLRR